MTATTQGAPRRAGGKAAARRVMVRGGVIATSLAVLAASWFGVSQTTVGRTVRAAAATQAYTQQATTPGFVVAPAVGSTRSFVTRSRAS